MKKKRSDAPNPEGRDREGRRVWEGLSAEKRALAQRIYAMWKRGDHVAVISEQTGVNRDELGKLISWWLDPFKMRA